MFRASHQLFAQKDFSTQTAKTASSGAAYSIDSGNQQTPPVVDKRDLGYLQNQISSHYKQGATVALSYIVLHRIASHRIYYYSFIFHHCTKWFDTSKVARDEAVLAPVAPLLGLSSVVDDWLLPRRRADREKLPSVGNVECVQVRIYNAFRKKDANDDG
jgi:hypothetical protein